MKATKRASKLVLNIVKVAEVNECVKPLPPLPNQEKDIREVDVLRFLARPPLSTSRCIFLHGHTASLYHSDRGSEISSSRWVFPSFVRGCGSGWVPVLLLWYYIVASSGLGGKSGQLGFLFCFRHGFLAFSRKF